MAIYKGTEIDDQLHGLIGRMGRVEEYRESLQNLQTVWDNLTLLGYLSGTGADMSETRGAFQQLTGSLLNHLGRETLKKTVLAMKSKAQVAVDIMIRNLFERTADIGFLAMDGMVRDYLKSADEREVLRPALLAHFREYVRKYSVYSNILLLDTDGRVLLQLDDNNPVTHSRDALVGESLSTSAAYVETFRKTDLAPRQDAALIYSFRVTDDAGANIGVLCLNFHFANETERIFANLVGRHDWSAITLLDRDGRVIASSDRWHIPVGAKLEMAQDGDWKVVRAAGREYLAVTRPTQGYQGYMGPGWYGQVMLPLDHAFEHDNTLDMGDIPASALHAVTGNPNLFDNGLREIPGQAASIQRGLNRSVWNGNVSQRSSDRKAMNPAFSKVLLWEISNTGLKTQNVFESSIGNLHQMVVSSILQDSQFQAALAIDIMDRNLYERANDCRWWALAPVFRDILSQPAMDDAARKVAGDTLTHINSLYTVYDNLVLFDRNATVIAVSNPRYRELNGKRLAEDWVRQTLQLTNSQDYAVSAFAATPLYRDRRTYIYAAAVLDAADASRAVGGIGIVFDSAPQFAAMLNDALPRNEQGAVPPGCFGVFADRNRCVIASTRESMHPGDLLEIDEHFFRLANGQKHSGIAVFNGHYYAVGASVSGGYREYKDQNDAYRNDVVALVFAPLGEKRQEERRGGDASRSRMQRNNIKTESDGEAVEIATFYVDSHWLGIESRYVVEAVDIKGVTSVPGSGENMQGYMMFRGNIIPVVALWGMLGESDRRRSSGNDPQIIVLELRPGVLMGVMVDDLGEIPEIPLTRIEKISDMLGGGNSLSESLVKPDGQDMQSRMIVIISPEKLHRRFIGA